MINTRLASITDNSQTAITLFTVHLASLRQVKNREHENDCWLNLVLSRIRIVI